MTGKRIEKSIKIGGRTLTLSTGDLANQATSAVLARMGDTVVLSTLAKKPLLADLGYFPLSVEYQERLYAGGRIKGSRWVKREGRPSDEEIIFARMIDRSVRPLFPKDYLGSEVQIINTVLSVDLENPAEIVAAIASSAAIAISDLPWSGPVGVVRIGLKDGKFLINPFSSEQDEPRLDLELNISATSASVIMLEAFARRISEEKIIEAIKMGQAEAVKVSGLINELAGEVKPTKESLQPLDISRSLKEKIEKISLPRIDELLSSKPKRALLMRGIEDLKIEVVESLDDEDRLNAVKYLEKILAKKVREFILSGKRLDGRRHDQIRDIEILVGVLPRTHGSAIFRRGETQALSIATLGAPSLEQFIETATGEETKRYMHHYSMPPYSVGEVGKIGYPNRREIGHGALAEKALLPVIPGEDEFPYTIRVVTEILSSNGSTSMAAVCGSTLALMDAGVPIKEPVAGISIGLVMDGERNFSLLTDIAGLEDAYGDMDFKVAGTKDGITAIQLDVKTLNLTPEILSQALNAAKKARLEILEEMLKVLDKPRDSISPYAPKIRILRIDPEKIGDLIGPGGKTIRRIIKETGTQINVDEEGKVSVLGSDDEQLKLAIEKIQAITKEIKVGEIYQGVVKRIQPFGAFVEIAPGKEGLVHISEISESFVSEPSDILKIGDEVTVRVKGIDESGRVNLSMILEPHAGDFKRGRRGFGKRTFAKSNRSKGPHFPASRLMRDMGKKR